MINEAMKDTVCNVVKDIIVDFLYYDRKEDDDLPVGMIELLIKQGTITEKEIVDIFSKELSNGLND